jgi:hypothetical protein
MWKKVLLGVGIAAVCIAIILAIVLGVVLTRTSKYSTHNALNLSVRKVYPLKFSAARIECIPLAFSLRTFLYNTFYLKRIFLKPS